MSAAPLFRPQALQRYRGERTGDLPISQPVSLKAWLLAILLVTIAAGTWLVNGTYYRTEQVRGYLAPATGLERVKAPIGGEIDQLLVTDGQQVEAGMPLIRIVHREHTGSGQDQALVLREALIRQKASLEEEERAARALLIQRSTDMAATITEQQSAREKLQRQQPLQLRRLTNAQSQLAALTRLNQQQFLDRQTLTAAEQSVLRERQTLIELQTRLYEQSAQISAARRKLANLPAESELHRRELERLAATIDQQLAMHEATRVRVVVAPRSAQVTGIAVSEGAPVNVGQALLTLVPEGAPLVARLLIPDRAAGFIKPGQLLKLAFDAFPHEKFGLQPATISQFSGAVYAPADSPVPVIAPMFIATAELASQQLIVSGQPTKLRIDQQFSAEIILEQRTLLEWLVAPVIALRGWDE